MRRTRILGIGLDFDRSDLSGRFVSGHRFGLWHKHRGGNHLGTFGVGRYVQWRRSSRVVAVHGQVHVALELGLVRATTTDPNTAALATGQSNCQYLWIGVFQATSVSVC